MKKLMITSLLLLSASLSAEQLSPFKIEPETKFPLLSPITNSENTSSVLIPKKKEPSLEKRDPLLTHSILSIPHIPKIHYVGLIKEIPFLCGIMTKEFDDVDGRKKKAQKAASETACMLTLTKLFNYEESVLDNMNNIKKNHMFVVKVRDVSNQCESMVKEAKRWSVDEDIDQIDKYLMKGCLKTLTKLITKRM